jgi:coproporphyrinogen III oxidase-like Fe-S oxidoreductase
MKKLLELIKETYDAVNFVRGSFTQVTLFGNLLNKKQFTEVMKWLQDNGAGWQDDCLEYEAMGMEDTYHLYLHLPYVKLYCGFIKRNEIFSDKGNSYANMSEAVLARNEGKST